MTNLAVIGPAWAVCEPTPIIGRPAGWPSCPAAVATDETTALTAIPGPGRSPPAGHRRRVW